MARPVASPEQREQQKKKIQRAAADLYAEKGLAGVSARAIAVRAEISAGTIYSYFANLEDLMRSLWTEPVARANRDIEAVAKATPDPVERIRAMLEAYAEFAHARPEVYRGALLFVRPVTQSKPEARPIEELPLYRQLRDALREGQAAGAIIPGDPDELAQLLWSGLHGSIGLSANIDLYEIAPPQQLAPGMIRLLMRSITA